MEENKTRVSVAMASYNGLPYIREQTESILKNLTAEDELVISDDGSTDGTMAFLTGLAQCDARVQILRGPGNGIKKNFENAAKHCSGDYIFLADQDDVWTEDKVKKVLAVFETQGVTLVMHDAVVVNEDNSKEIMPSFFAYRGSKAGAAANIIKNTYMGCCMAFRREVMQWILPIPEEIQMHDQWIGVLNDLKGNGTCILPEKLLYYRRHEHNNSDFSHNTLLVMIKNRIVFLRALKRQLRYLKNKKILKKKGKY